MNLKEAFEKEVESMTLEDMPTEDMRHLAESCGVDVAIKLLKTMAGINIYIPLQIRFRKVIERFVVKEFNSANAKILAQACNISINYVYEIVQREDEKRCKTKVRQESLFEQVQENK